MDSAIGTYAARMRGSARGSAEQDAMSDPYGRGDSACMAALDQIEQSVDEGGPSPGQRLAGQEIVTSRQGSAIRARCRRVCRSHRCGSTRVVPSEG